MKADLHIHSIYSDGEDTPEQIAAEAKAKGIELISLTDHDTVDGAEDMKKAAKKYGIECFTGIELSSFSCAEIHILGYNVDIYKQDFIDRLSVIKNQRKTRVKKIVQKLQALKIDIAEQEVYSFADDKASVGRLHIAKALVSKKLFNTVADAFDRMLAYGKAAYIPSDRITPKEAINLIACAGGKSVLAHPLMIDIKKQNLLPLIKQLADYGLNGIEASYYAHNKFETDFLLQLAGNLKLIATGGSDYHGKLRLSEIYGYDLKEEDYNRLKT